MTSPPIDAITITDDDDGEVMSPCIHVNLKKERCLLQAGHGGKHSYVLQDRSAERRTVGTSKGVRRNWRNVLDVVDGIENQPLTGLQWVDRNELFANGYNPNHVAPSEFRLLKISILSSGWTQPIVARPDGEIVDGFHRWTVSADREVSAMTGGLVPVVRLRSDTPEAEQRMATIRHNRARGTHGVVRMADIVAGLVSDGVSRQDIAERLQMDHEEVDRLLDRGSMLERHRGMQFGQAWGVVPNKDAPKLSHGEEPDRQTVEDTDQGTRE